MAKISNYGLYDIDDLVAIWKKGWKELSELGDQRKCRGLIHDTFACKSLCLSRRMWLGFEAVYAQIAWDSDAKPSWLGFRDLLALVSVPTNTRIRKWSQYVYRFIPKSADHGGSAIDDAALIKNLKVLLSAFLTSTTVGGAFEKLSTKSIRDKCCEIPEPAKLKKIFRAKIDRYRFRAMEWLMKGLNKEVSCEEVWWSCVWQFAEPVIQNLMEIQNLIEADRPLDEKQLHILNTFMEYGYPQGNILIEDDGTEAYRICLDPTNADPPYTVLNLAVFVLLIGPAFLLAQQLQTRCSIPRFVKQCRAPSCGKSFYTRRKNATACPGSQGNKKNECALEWIRYQRYLGKIRKDPEKVWGDPQFKEQFISYDNRKATAHR